VLLDDKTAARHPLPLGRELLAQVIEALDRAGARAVALDLLLADPLGDSGDLTLAMVTAESRGVIHAMDLLQASGPGERPEPLPPRFAVPLASDGLLTANRAVLPMASLLEKAHLLGGVGLLVDEDGLIRRVPLLVRYQGRAYPSLGLAAVSRALGALLEGIRWRPGEPLVITPARGAPLTVPVDERACLRISVRGTLASRHAHSFVDVLALARAERKDELRRRFGGRVVLLGVSASGQKDIQPLPGIGAPPLVLAHAMAVETMLGRDFVHVSGWPTLLLLVGALALLALLAGARLPWYLLVPLIPAGIAALWLGSSTVLGRWGLALPLIAPSVALAVGGLVGWGLRFGVEQRQRRLLAEALGRYLPRRVSGRILSDPRALRLGGQRKELSLVALRLQGFGALSEQLEPEEVGQLLSSVFAAAAAVVTRYDGTLDRFSGEGVRAFFNDPVPCPEHAARAVACALELRSEVQGLLARWARDGRPRPPLGVAVHTGYVTVGNIGAVQRMEYTAVGRNVETTERLAEAAPAGTVLVSGRTRARAEERFVFEPRGALDPGLETFEACAPR
jgi:adenylate cyclase